MKKVLILTASIGGGHNAAAAAIAASLRAEDPSVEIETVELLKEYSNKLNCLVYEKGYALSISSIPTIYDKSYAKLKTNCEKSGGKNNMNIIQLSTVSMIEGMYKKINEFRPDVICCTHFFPALVTSDIRHAYSIPAKIIMTNLDYNITPFWNHALKVDYLTIAHEDQIKQCRRMGFRDDQIAVTGIPAADKFFNSYDKKEVRRELGLDENMTTVLVMFGGGNWSGTHKIVRLLTESCDSDIQLIVINGVNKKTYKAIEKMEMPANIKLVNVGFTDKVEKYMAASDAGITKAGGLSTTEMINIGLPMIISRSVYGQERLNLEFLQDHGACLSYSGGTNLGDKIELCLKRRDDLLTNMEKLRLRAACNISGLILSQPEAQYDDVYIAGLDYKKVTMNCVKKISQKDTVNSKKEQKPKRRKQK